MANLNSKIKQIIKISIEWIPCQGNYMISNYKKAKLMRNRIYIKFLNVISTNDIPHSETIYWINPNRIIYHTNYEGRINGNHFEDNVFDPIKDKGKVVGGNWDISDYKFEDLDIYKAFEMRINKKIRWQETPFYSSLLKMIGSDNHPWGIRNKNDLDKRCNYFDTLIESIKNKGYLEDYQIKLDSEEQRFIKKHPETSNEISVNIGRNGKYLFQDGRHRLSIAKILGIKSIPVKVLVRHRAWVDLRQLLIKMKNDKHGAGSRHGYLYQPPIHPDLLDIPAYHNCEDRFLAISNHICNQTGTLLDIGSNFGFFSHKFEDLGYTCFAVEQNYQISYIAQLLRFAEGKRFRIIKDDLFEAAKKPPLKDLKFDIVLALNIFHHFLKKKESFDKFICWLKKLSAKELFFEPHNYNESQMANSYCNFTEAEFIDFILSITPFKKSSLIHMTDDGRSIYHLT